MAITQYENIQKLSATAAEFVCHLAAQSVTAHDYFTLALSGGSTPRTLYQYLANRPYSEMMPWRKTHIFWGDERYVPAKHPDNNFFMASQILIDQIPIPSGNVHRIPTDAASPENAAERYETILREHQHIFDALSPSKEVPVFDLILLGIGPDGHTASLFPGSPALHEQTHWVAATSVPHLDPPVRRITLTFPVINAARNIIFLAFGKEKQTILHMIQDNPEKARTIYPAARVKPISGRLFRFVA